MDMWKAARKMAMTGRLLGMFALVPFLLGMIDAPDGSDPITNAARTGDLEAVQALIESGAEVNAATGDGMTPLHWAAQRGDVEMANALISAGADVGLGTRIGHYPPLHIASRGGYTAIARLLVDAGADVTLATTNTGATPLHLAAASAGGGAELVRLLVTSGAEINARDASAGLTPLMFAAAAGRVDAVRELMAQGADASVTGAVTDVLNAGVRDRQADQALQSALAEMRFSEGGGEDWSPSPAQLQAAIQAQREAAAGEYVVEDRSDLIQDQVRRVNSQRLRVVQPRLPIRQVQVGKTGGLSALQLAAREGQFGAVEALLEGGAEVNQVSDGTGASALLTAAINGHYDVAYLLVERGADPNLAKWPENISPLFAVLQSQYPGTPTYAQPQAHHLQETSHIELVEALLEAGADPNVGLDMHLWYWEYNQGRVGINIEGATPFWRAAFARDLEAMKLLVAHGADPSLPTTQPSELMLEARTPDGRQEESSGLKPVPEGAPTMYPIHAAAGGGFLGIGASSVEGMPDGFLPAVKYLIEEHGADVNVPDSWGYTPLHYAATRGDLGLIEYLVEQGADVTAMSRLGMSPADMARGGQRGFFMQAARPDAEALLVELGSPRLCRDLHFDGTGDVCPTAGTSAFEDLYGYPRTPLHERHPSEKWGWDGWQADDAAGLQEYEP